MAGPAIIMEEAMLSLAARFHEKLRQAAETAGKQGILLVLEDEFECNMASARQPTPRLSGSRSIDGGEHSSNPATKHA